MNKMPKQYEYRTSQKRIISSFKIDKENSQLTWIVFERFPRDSQKPDKTLFEIPFEGLYDQIYDIVASEHSSLKKFEANFGLLRRLLAFQRSLFADFQKPILKEAEKRFQEASK